MIVVTVFALPSTKPEAIEASKDAAVWPKSWLVTTAPLFALVSLALRWKTPIAVELAPGRPMARKVMSPTTYQFDVIDAVSVIAADAPI